MWGGPAVRVTARGNAWRSQRLMVMRVVSMVVLIAALAACGASNDPLSQAQGREATPSASLSPSASAAPGRTFVPAPFAVKEIRRDRGAVTVVVAGIAGGCTGPARAEVAETGDGLVVRAEVSVPDPGNVPCTASLPMRTVTVELPRLLRQDEHVLGECVPNDMTPSGRQCATTHAFREVAAAVTVERVMPGGPSPVSAARG